MKRILSLVLAFVFVFTLAGVASADFSISGQFIAKYHTLNVPGSYFDTSKWVLETAADTSDTSRIEITVKGTYGNVTADFKERIRLSDNTGNNPVTEGRTANIFYNFSKQLSVGLTWDKSGDTAYQVYQSPIIPDLQWEYIDFPAVQTPGTQYGGTDVYAVAKVNTGDLAATIISPLFEQVGTTAIYQFKGVMAGFTYNLDPIQIAGGFKYVYHQASDKYFYALQPSVMYALSNEVQLGSELYYTNADSATVETAVGIGGLYKTQEILLNGGVYYDLKNSAIGAYGLEAEYTGVPNFKFYAYYYYNNETDFLKKIDDDETKFASGNKDSIEAGVTYYLDPKKMAWIDVAYCKLDRQWYEIEFGVKF